MSQFPLLLTEHSVVSNGFPSSNNFSYPPPNPRVLIVESDARMGRFLTDTLGESGLEIRLVTDLRSAVNAISTGDRLTAVVCGFRLSDGNGMVLLEWMRNQLIPVPFLLVGSVEAERRPRSRFARLPDSFISTQLFDALDALLPGGLFNAAGIEYSIAA